VSSDRADRDARQETTAKRDVSAVADDATLILGPLTGGPDRGVAGSVAQPPEEDMTVIFRPLAPEMDRPAAARIQQCPVDDATLILSPLVLGADHATADGVPQPPENDMNVMFGALAWGPMRDPIVVGNIPQQPPGFLPRPALFAQLDRAGRGTSGVRVLIGMHGVGKTQLAAAYARAKLAAGWRLVAWVNAGDAGSLLAGLAAVAEAVGLSEGVPGRDAADLGRAVRQKLEADGDRCLLVFDDVKEPDLVRPFVPADGAARVLITSMRPSVTNLGITVPVAMFSREETLAFLAERTGLGEDGAAAVAGELGSLPLTLAQAAAFMAEQRTGYETYLKRLHALPARDYLTREGQQPDPRGVAESVLLSMDAIRANDRAGVCAGIMEMMAVLSAVGVRREMLHAAGQAGALAKRGLRSRVSAALVDRALVRLAARSLLTFSLDGQTVIAHSLVMGVIREKLARRGRLAAACWTAASVLDMRAGTLATSRNRVAIQDIPEQVTALQQSAAGSGAETDHELARALLSLQFWALYQLSELGDSVSQAIAVGERVVAEFEREFGADHPDTMSVRNRLALAYLAAGRAAEAIRLFEQTLARQERLSDVGNADTLTTQNSLAAAYQAAGLADEAIRLYELTLVARQRLLGVDHADTLTTQNNLAAVYWEAGRAAEAIRSFEQTLAARQRLLGPDHPRTLNSRGNLAAAYREAGRAAEAIALFEQTLAGQERLLGPDHPNIQRLRSNLANAYHSLGRVGEAIPLREQTLATCERVLGAGHPRTLKSKDILAAAYRDAGRAAEAIRLYKQTLTVREQLLGADHPDTVATQKSLAATRREAGQV
jgi:tetratricopeptide (TPR) repeat protein